MRILHYGVIGTMGALVGILVVLVSVRPPAEETRAPQARLVPVFQTDAGGFGLPNRMIGITTGARPLTADSLSEDIPGMGYDLDLVGSGNVAVPRLFLSNLPSDLESLNEEESRKVVFFRVVLPLILYANEEIVADRKRLWRIRYAVRRGLRLSPQDRLWLIIKAEEYRAEPGELDDLARRIDVVPPSLALATAALNSDWGTSALSHQKNALFGLPVDAAPQVEAVTSSNLTLGRAQEAWSFDSLLESVRAYVQNLNVHPAYDQFRETRADMRRGGAPLDGVLLIPSLKTASQQRAGYTDTVQSIMEANDLRRLDDARLQYAPSVSEPSA